MTISEYLSDLKPVEHSKYAYNFYGFLATEAEVTSLKELASFKDYRFETGSNIAYEKEFEAEVSQDGTWSLSLYNISTAKLITLLKGLSS